MAVEELRRRVLEGPIFSTILGLSVPLIVTQLVQVLYGIVDMFWLGRVSTAALSAPTPAWSLVTTLMAFEFAIAIPSAALVSQYVGKKEWSSAMRVSSTSVLLSMLVGAIVSLSVLPFSHDLLSFLSSGHAVKEIESYTLGLLLFLPFLFLSMSIASILRALGDMWKIATLYGLTTVFNLFLDPILIFGLGPIPSLGTLGAGIATGCSMLLSGLFGIWILRRHGFSPKLEVDKGAIRRIGSLGAPIFLSYFLKGSAIMATVKLFSFFGTAAIAAYGVVQKISRFSSYVAFGTSGATSTMVGQALGKGDFERARKSLRTAVSFTFAVMLAISFVLGFFGREIASLFTSDPEVVELSSIGLWIYAPTMPFLGIIFPVSSALNAAGRTAISSALGIGRFWLLRLPIAYVLGRILNSAVGVFMGIGLANLITGLVALAFLFDTRWMRRIV